ncbi:PstS family phosphate ABC transporter substrate-binding protein [Demequina flava]|uniref:PstS family phosphate ABC transporter substrate-binding protein n=1 Tax=Demequina flava TaxID=1095025 RepID=UPI000782B925|nr:PstS family phosphate ABC transporter substrate-binding protein [Demequina flava]
MTIKFQKFAPAGALAVSAALLLAACGSSSDDASSAEETTTESTAAASAEGGDAGLTGTIAADGSSTVAPLTEAAADAYRDVQPEVQVTVATSGTGGGFAAFCADETDISDASRPIKDEEAAECAAAGVEFTEIIIANDGLSVVVNPENDWAQCLTVEQLHTIWSPESEGEVMSWSDVDSSFPDEPLTLYGAGTDSGTFDYFTDVINGEEGASRTDYSPSEDDNVTIQGVSGELGGLGYFGLSYLEENPDIIKGVEIDGGEGCVYPSTETVQDGSYSPLGRPLFIYVNNANYAEKPELQDFIDYYVSNSGEIAQSALFVPLTDDQIETAESELASLVG